MENISKQVISLEEKRVVGYVLKPLIDYKSLARVGYIIVDEESEQEYFLKNENIVNISDNLLIDSISNLEYMPESDELRKHIISDTGEDLGTISSFMFVNRKLRKIITDKCEIDSKYVREIGRDILLISLKRKKRSFPRFEKEDIKVEIMESEISVPPVINLSPNYYIGKVAVKTLLGFNNELIIREGEKVSKAILDKAKKHNKINQLFFIIK